MDILVSNKNIAISISNNSRLAVPTTYYARNNLLIGYATHFTSKQKIYIVNINKMYWAVQSVKRTYKEKQFIRFIVSKDIRSCESEGEQTASPLQPPGGGNSWREFGLRNGLILVFLKEKNHWLCFFSTEILWELK